MNRTSRVRSIGINCRPAGRPRNRDTIRNGECGMRNKGRGMEHAERGMRNEESRAPSLKGSFRQPRPQAWGRDHPIQAGPEGTVHAVASVGPARVVFRRTISVCTLLQHLSVLLEPLRYGTDILHACRRPIRATTGQPCPDGRPHNKAVRFDPGRFSVSFCRPRGLL